MSDRELALQEVLRLARKMCANYTLGMDDEDPRKGLGNRLADALKAYDEFCADPECLIRERHKYLWRKCPVCGREMALLERCIHAEAIMTRPPVAGE